MSTEPSRVAMMRYLVPDYTVTTGAGMQALAAKYFGGKAGWRLAVIPQGQTLATKVPSASAGR